MTLPLRSAGPGVASFGTKWALKIYGLRATRAICCLMVSGIMYEVRESWTDERMDDFDALQQTLLRVGAAMVVGLIGVMATLIAAIATQL